MAAFLSLICNPQRCAVLNLFVRSKIKFTLKGEVRRSLMRGCCNLRLDCIQKYASLSQFSSFIFNQQNFTNRA